MTAELERQVSGLGAKVASLLQALGDAGSARGEMSMQPPGEAVLMASSGVGHITSVSTLGGAPALLGALARELPSRVERVEQALDEQRTAVQRLGDEAILQRLERAEGQLQEQRNSLHLQEEGSAKYATVLQRLVHAEGELTEQRRILQLRDGMSGPSSSESGQRQQAMEQRLEDLSSQVLRRLELADAGPGNSSLPSAVPLPAVAGRTLMMMVRTFHPGAAVSGAAP